MKNCFIEKESSVKRYTMPLYHSHNYYELYFLAQGDRSFNIENDNYSLSQNDLLIVPANYQHKTSGAGFTRYLLNFTQDYLNESELAVVEQCEQQKISLSKEESAKFIDLLETLLLIQSDNLKDNQKNSEYNYKTCFSFLMYTLSTFKNFPKKKYLPRKRYKARTKQILNYIEKHYKDEINLDFFCKMFYISEPALVASFKKDTGMTIMNYLLLTRLKKAQGMLMYSNKSIEQISDECGFSSRKYFTLIFTKHIKISPLKFRKTNQIILNYSDIDSELTKL